MFCMYLLFRSNRLDPCSSVARECPFNLKHSIDLYISPCWTVSINQICTCSCTCVVMFVSTLYGKVRCNNNGITMPTAIEWSIFVNVCVCVCVCVCICVCVCVCACAHVPGRKASNHFKNIKNTIKFVKQRGWTKHKSVAWLFIPHVQKFVQHYGTLAKPLFQIVVIIHTNCAIGHIIIDNV